MVDGWRKRFLPSIRMMFWNLWIFPKERRMLIKNDYLKLNIMLMKALRNIKQGF